MDTTMTSFDVTIPEIPTANEYVLTLQGPDREPQMFMLTPNDVVDGMLSYSFGNLTEGETYDVDLEIVDDDGERIPITRETVTLPGIV